MNREQLERLRDRMDALDTQEHAQLFEIVKRHTQKFTQTETGVLVSTDHHPGECLQELDRMISFFTDQRKRMDADTLERKAMTRQ
jgi:hypothetical protein